MKATIFCIGLTLILAGCQSAEQAAFAKVAAEFPEAEAAAKKAGVVTDGKDLYPSPPIAEKDNSAPLIVRSGTLIKEVNRAHAENWKEIQELAGLSDSASVKKLGERLAVYAPGLKLATEAARRPKCDFGRKWDSEEAWKLQFPEFALGKELVKVQSFRGVQRARTGDTAGSLEDFRSAFRVSVLMGTDPTLISGLVQVATNAIVCRSVEMAITARPGDARYLGELKSILMGQPESIDLENLYRGETVTGYAYVRQVGKLSPKKLQELSEMNFDDPETESTAEVPEEYKAIYPAGVSAETLTNAYLTRNLQVWTEVFRVLKADPNPLKINKKLEAMMTEISASKDPTQNCNKLVFPVFSQAGNAFVKRTANLRTAIGLIDVLLFKKEHGKYPATLAAAGFKGMDPFDGKPLRYRVEDGEARVYSIDQDLVDDHGAARNQAIGSHNDVAAIYPRPNRKSELSMIPKTLQPSQPGK